MYSPSLRQKAFPMSEKRTDNHPKSAKTQNTGLDTDLLESGAEGPTPRKGDRESHHAASQPRAASVQAAARPPSPPPITPILLI